jgi:hypothetical protein
MSGITRVAGALGCLNDTSDLLVEAWMVGAAGTFSVKLTSTL